MKDPCLEYIFIVSWYLKQFWLEIIFVGETNESIKRIIIENKWSLVKNNPCKDNLVLRRIFTCWTGFRYILISYLACSAWLAWQMRLTILWTISEPALSDTPNWPSQSTNLLNNREFTDIHVSGFVKQNTPLHEACLLYLCTSFYPWHLTCPKVWTATPPPKKNNHHRPRSLLTSASNVVIIIFNYPCHVSCYVKTILVYRHSWFYTGTERIFITDHC